MQAAYVQPLRHAGRRQPGPADVTAEAAPAGRSAFVLFALVNAVLFVRPNELVPAIRDWPVYELLMVGCLALALPRLARQLAARSLAANPITACVVGLLGAVVLSHLSHGFVWGARTSGLVFLKIVLYYLLLVGTVDTPDRLRRFLLWVSILVFVLAGLALLHYHGVLHNEALDTLQYTERDAGNGEAATLVRLRAAGIFNDPNDLCLILGFGLVVCAYRVADRASSWWGRLLGLGRAGVFGYALVLTQSRGGLIGAVTGLLVFLAGRFGWKKAALLSLPALAVMFVLIGGGRQAALSTGEGTAHERIEKWAEGFDLLRRAPVFGIGEGNFAEEVGLVAHNSFVQSYAELGLFGGTLFVGGFYLSVSALRRFGRKGRAGDVPQGLDGLDPELARLRPYLLAITCAYAAGIFSLSRTEAVPTYMILGLGAAFFSIARSRAAAVPQRDESGAAPALLRLGGPLLRRLALVSAAAVVGLYVFVRVSLYT